MILKENEQQLLNQLKETLGNYKSEAEVDSVWENIDSTLNTNKKNQSGFFTQAFFLKIITGLMIFITGMLFYLNFDLAKQIDKRKKVADLLNSPSDVTELVIAYPQEKYSVKPDNANTLVVLTKEETAQELLVEEKKVESKRSKAKKGNLEQVKSDTEKTLLPASDTSLPEHKTTEGSPVSDVKDVTPTQNLVPLEKSESIKDVSANEAVVSEKDSTKEEKIKKARSNPFKSGKHYNIPLKKKKSK